MAVVAPMTVVVDVVAVTVCIFLCVCLCLCSALASVAMARRDFSRRLESNGSINLFYITLHMAFRFVCGLSPIKMIEINMQQINQLID